MNAIYYQQEEGRENKENKTRKIPAMDKLLRLVLRFQFKRFFCHSTHKNDMQSTELRIPYKCSTKS